MRYLIKKLLPHLARLHKANWKKGRWKYPQLWYCMPSRFKGCAGKPKCCSCGRTINLPRGAQMFPGVPAMLCPKCSTLDNPPLLSPQNARPSIVKSWLRDRLQSLCGFATGHEISLTESGYGGGRFVDRNCRWCDKRIQVPKEEDPAMPALFDELRGLEEG